MIAKANIIQLQCS